MTHYATLGLEPGATADEIKAAYRHATLGDPESRARYDETGVDSPEAELEQAARNVLLQMFSQVITVVDPSRWLAEVQSMLSQMRHSATSAKTEAVFKRRQLAKLRGRVRVKKGINLVQMLIDESIKELDATAANAAQNLNLQARAAKMFAEYESVDDMVAAGEFYLPAGYTMFTGQGG